MFYIALPDISIVITHYACPLIYLFLMQRISADDALNHEWFREVPLPKTKDFMPTFPALNEQDRRIKKYMKSPDPLVEQQMKEQGSSGDRGLFG